MTRTYKIGFARPALIQETAMIAKLYIDLRDWAEVKSSITQANLLQTRTERTAEIIFVEVHKRLSLLNEEQVALIVNRYEQDVRQLVWIALCKQYLFIGDFTLEVIASAGGANCFEVTYEDYSQFFYAKAEWHPELERVSNKTRSNARQALFQMMRQCELITESNVLLPQMLSAAIKNCSSPEDLAFIPRAIRL